MNQDQQLREALDELGSCHDDYNYLLGITENKNNLHGWLRMRLARVATIRYAVTAAQQAASAQREQPAASKPEPQAQEGDPCESFCKDTEMFGIPSLESIGLTTQKPREYAAALRIRWQKKFDEAIAEKDAALKTCVGALESLFSGVADPERAKKCQAAITQGQEALK